MTPQQLHELKDELRGHIDEVIAASIKTTVNGKIDRMHHEMNDFITRAEPAIKNFENIKWGYKVLLGAAMFIGAIGGAVLMIKNLFLK